MPRLTNANLVAKAHEYRLAVATAKTAKAKADEIRDEVLAELARRNKDSFTGEGITVTRKVRRYRKFSTEILKKRLHPAVYAEVAPPTVVVKSFDENVKNGRIPADVAADAVVGFDESAPFLDVEVQATAA